MVSLPEIACCSVAQIKVQLDRVERHLEYLEQTLADLRTLQAREQSAVNDDRVQAFLKKANRDKTC